MRIFLLSILSLTLLFSTNNLSISKGLSYPVPENVFTDSREYLRVNELRQTWSYDSTWRNSQLKTFVEYNDLNLETESITQRYLSPDYENLENVSREESEYNLDGINIYNLTQTWIDSIWVNNGRLVYEYENNLIQSALFEQWRDNEWQIFFSWDYNFNEDDIWTTIDIQQYNQQDSSISTKKMTNLNPIIPTAQDTITWLTELMVDDSIWTNEILHISNFNVIDDVWQTNFQINKNWIDGAWVNQYFYEYEYMVEPQHMNIEEMYGYQWNDYEWELYFASHYEYNSNNDYVSQLNYNGLDSIGNLSPSSLRTYTYDNNYNLLEELYQTWNDNYWKNSQCYISAYENITLGDLNDDGIANVIDIVLLVNSILGDNNYSDAFDLNNDNYIDVLDVVLLVNIII